MMPPSGPELRSERVARDQMWLTIAALLRATVVGMIVRSTLIVA
jgi:hypothetical protein